MRGCAGGAGRVRSLCQQPMQLEIPQTGTNGNYIVRKMWQCDIVHGTPSKGATAGRGKLKRCLTCVQHWNSAHAAPPPAMPTTMAEDLARLGLEVDLARQLATWSPVASRRGVQFHEAPHRPQVYGGPGLFIRFMRRWRARAPRLGEPASSRGAAAPSAGRSKSLLSGSQAGASARSVE